MDARAKTGSYVLYNKDGQQALVEDTIFTDMLQKKAKGNVTLFYDHGSDSWRHRNNCYYLRIHPPSERELVGNPTIHELRDRIVDPLFADPQFACDPSKEGTFGIDQMMNHNYPLDFNSFFATNPEVVRRGMRLQGAAFADFEWSRR